MGKGILTAKEIRKAVKVLQKRNVEPVDGHYWAKMRFANLLDILFTYKRPRATKLYKLVTEWIDYYDGVV